MGAVFRKVKRYRAADQCDPIGDTARDIAWVGVMVHFGRGTGSNKPAIDLPMLKE
jgi:hypothetical protein